MRVCIPLAATSRLGKPAADFELAAHFGLAERALGFRLLQMSRRAGLPALDTNARMVGELCCDLRTAKLRTMPTARCFNSGRSRVAGRG